MANVEQIIKYKFKNPQLLKSALTHSSVSSNVAKYYERLEFFGDSVLKLFTSKLLYENYENYPEGDLSKIRSILVSDAILSGIAFEIGLDKLIKLGPAEEKQGGRKRESNLACSLEAVLGAYYLSGEDEAVEKFISKYVLPYAKDIDEHFEKYNAKDILQQYTQSIDKTLPVYRTVAVHGPAHKPEFEIAVEWQDRIIATAKGKSKKDAQQNCAYEACKALGVVE